MLGSQSPMSANERHAARTPSAALTPPKRSSSRTNAAVVPTQVRSSRSEFSHDTRLSRKELNPLKIEKTKLGSGSLRLFESERWKLSRCPESEFQTSQSGHGYCRSQMR